MARRASAVSTAGWCSWRPRYIRYVVPAVRTSASSSASNTVAHLARQVLAVHVVDRVRQRAADAERPGRAEARPVLDVAALVAVEPVHRRDAVAVRARRPVAIDAAQTGVTDGKAATQSSTYWPRSHQQRHGRRLARGRRPARASRASWRRRPRGRACAGAAAHARHRRMRRPAYFSPWRRRPPASSHARPAIDERAPAAGRARTGRPRRAPAPRGRAAAARPRRRRGACAPGRTAAGRPAAPSTARSHGDERSRRHRVVRGRRACPPPSSAGDDDGDRAEDVEPGAGVEAVLARRGGGRSRTTTRPTSIASRKGACSRNAKSVPSKSTPRSAAASAPTSRAGRKGRMPTAAPIPAAWRRSRTVCTLVR